LVFFSFFHTTGTLCGYAFVIQASHPYRLTRARIDTHTHTHTLHTTHHTQSTDTTAQLATDNNSLNYLLGPTRYCCTRYKALIRLIFYVQKQLGFRGSKPSNMALKTARSLILAYRAPHAWLDQARSQIGQNKTSSSSSSSGALGAAAAADDDATGAQNNSEDALIAQWFAESLSKQFPPAMKYIALGRLVPTDHGAGKKDAAGRVGKIQNKCGLSEQDKAEAETIIGQHIQGFFNGVAEKQDADADAARARKKESKKRKREAAMGAAAAAAAAVEVAEVASGNEQAAGMANTRGDGSVGTRKSVRSSGRNKRRKPSV
jgi:hypothetical protein